MSNAVHALLIAAFDEFHVSSASFRAGTAAICFGESGFVPHTELGYANTPNARIRTIFGSRVAGLSDVSLTHLKSNDEAFFDVVYGGAWGANNLGNAAAGDGYKYRGRGFNQLTGRGNYGYYGKLLGVDLLGDPDMVNDPTTAARLAVSYMLHRCAQSDDFETMKRAVGNAVASTEAAKDAAYATFLASNEFGGVAVSATSVVGQLTTDELNDASLAAAKLSEP